jgi:predicted glycogen debranching enzyme
MASPAPIRVPTAVVADLASGSSLEWLETNGLGSFAMGTVGGLATRRYHGLLVASLRPPTERILTLARLDEKLMLPDGAVELATVKYPGVVAPAGHFHLVEFRLDPFPTWTWDVGGVRVDKQVFLVHGANTVVVRYRASRPVELAVAPFLAFRDYHSLAAANASFAGDAAEEAGAGGRTLTVKPYASLPALRIIHGGGALVRDGGWYYRAEYDDERERGLDFTEDLYRLGAIPLAVAPDAPGWIVATLDGGAWDAAAVDAAEAAERARREQVGDDPLLARLGSAADAFLVRRADGTPTIIAGYPWFTDWGRDTMISLPGLLVARGRLDDARRVISGFLRHVDRGLIPNRFPDRGEEPEYNNVDGTLWMFLAMHAYLEAGGDRQFLADEFYPAAREIIRWHQRGTQLTWMDARVDGRVITPRHGKAVEINALWYNALRLMAAWGREVGDEHNAAAYAAMAEVVERSFARTFWNKGRGCLYDVVRPDGADARIRPNQIFAVSLPFPLLAPEQQRRVVDVVERELLTRVGLRTLAPGEDGYVRRYKGGPAERDGAYHQGTVWPWLLGGFVRAYLRVHGRSADTLARCRGFLAGIARHLEDEACLGTISEVFDAEPPHHPGGAPAQAWSVAELYQLVAVDLRDADATPQLKSASSAR